MNANLVETNYLILNSFKITLILVYQTVRVSVCIFYLKAKPLKVIVKYMRKKPTYSVL